MYFCFCQIPKGIRALDGIATTFGDIIRGKIEYEILKILNEIDTDYDFTPLPRLFEVKK